MERTHTQHVLGILTILVAMGIPSCAADDDGDDGAGGGGDDGASDGDGDEDGGDTDGGDDGGDGTGGDGGDGTDGETDDGADDGTDDGTDDGPPPATCSSWEAQTGVPSVDFFDLDWLDAERAFVVGLGGTAITTADAGDTWTTADVGTSDDLRSVDFAPGADSDHGWILGGAGVEEYQSRGTTILHTTDGGGTWGPQSTGISFPPTRVKSVDSQHAWAMWGLGKVHPDGHWNRTSNGGANWRSGTGPDFTRPLRAMMDVFFIDENQGWAVGTNGKPQYNVGGQPSPSPLNNILGGILHTTDFGETWEVQSTDLPGGLYFMGVYFVDGSHGWVVDDEGHILVTENSGATWTHQDSGVSTALRSVWFKDASTGWVVGDGGVILHTTDAGATWEPQSSGTTDILRRVLGPVSGNPWAVGDGGTLLECL